MSIICLFFPAVIALQIDLNLNRIKKFDYLIIIKYIIYCFIINLFGNTAVWLISSQKYNAYIESNFNYDFCIKYMWLTLLIAILLPLIKKHVKISLKIQKKEVVNEKCKKNIK